MKVSFTSLTSSYNNNDNNDNRGENIIEGYLIINPHQYMILITNHHRHQHYHQNIIIIIKISEVYSLLPSITITNTTIRAFNPRMGIIVTNKVLNKPCCSSKEA